MPTYVSFRSLAAAAVCLATALAPAGCEAPRAQRDFSGDPAFRTTPPSHLFFKNVRASSYYAERPKGMELDLYRHRRFSQTAKRPMLIPVIIDDWMRDQAYLFVRPNDFAGIHDPLTVKVMRPRGDTVLTMPDVPTRPAQFAFANELYAQLLEGHRVYLLQVDSTYLPIYEQRAERASYLAVMQDYYRLTERI